MMAEPNQDAGSRETQSNRKLALYYYDSCPYCRMALKAIEKLNIDVELRNILTDSRHNDDLYEARGSATVPVLHIVLPDGEEFWMPESRDIVRYLMDAYE